jgi:hypothetical protein
MFGIMLVKEISVDTIFNLTAEWTKKLKRRSGQLKTSQWQWEELRY